MSGLRDLVAGGAGGCDDGASGGGGGGGASSSSASSWTAYPANPLGAFADALLRRGDGRGAAPSSSTALPPQQQHLHPVALAQRPQQPYAAASAEALRAAALAPPPLPVPGALPPPGAAAAAAPPPWAAEFSRQQQQQPYAEQQQHRAGAWAGEFDCTSAAAPFHRQQRESWAEQFSMQQQQQQQQQQQYQQNLHHQQHHFYQQQQPLYQNGGGGGLFPGLIDHGVPPLPPPLPEQQQLQEQQAPVLPPSSFSSLPSRGPTPTERRAARGPHPDDPLEEDAGSTSGRKQQQPGLFGPNGSGGNALTTSASSDIASADAGPFRGGPTWVRQFNEALADALVNGTANSGPTLEAEAEAVGALAPREANPFVVSSSSSASAGGDPLAAARDAATRGLPGAAALALEACVRRAPLAPGTWHALGLARADLGDGPGAVRALSRAAKLMERALQRCGDGGGGATQQGDSAPKPNPFSSSSSSSDRSAAALASSYPRALLDLALACFASGGIGASKVRAEGVEALSKWCCVTAEGAAAAAAGAGASPPFPPPPPPGAVSVAALDEHLRARAAALSSPSSHASSSSAAACRDARMALGCLRGLRAASGKGGESAAPSFPATAAADAFAAAAAAAAAASSSSSTGDGGGEGDDSVALAALGRALLSAGRAGHAVAALEKAAAGSGSAATWMLLGRARGQALMAAEANKGLGNDGGTNSSSPSPSLAAAAAFARAAQLAPDASPPWEALAAALTAAGREDLAAAADARRMPAGLLLGG